MMFDLVVTQYSESKWPCRSDYTKQSEKHKVIDVILSIMQEKVVTISCNNRQIVNSQLKNELKVGIKQWMSYVVISCWQFLLFQRSKHIWVIIQKQVKTMFSKNADFTNLDLFSCQDLDNYGSFSPDFNKPMLATVVPNFGNTNLNECQEFFYQKSAQDLAGSYQISFQKDFMKEHQVIFKKQLKNYMESFRIYSNKIGGLEYIQKEVLSKSQEQNISCIEFISANRLPISHEQTQNFVRKFNTYDKLSEFLNIVVSLCPKAISAQLILIAKQLLEKYQSVKIQLPNETELLKYASEVAQAPQFVELINLKEISFKKCKEATNLIQASKDFIEIFCATTMLVIGQYFQNPYIIEDMAYLKRQLPVSGFEDEQQEVQLQFSPAKKRKYQFEF